MAATDNNGTFRQIAWYCIICRINLQNFDQPGRALKNLSDLFAFLVIHAKVLPGSLLSIGEFTFVTGALEI